MAYKRLVPTRRGRRTDDVAVVRPPIRPHIGTASPFASFKGEELLRRIARDLGIFVSTLIVESGYTTRQVTLVANTPAQIVDSRKPSGYRLRNIETAAASASNTIFLGRTAQVSATNGYALLAGQELPLYVWGNAPVWAFASGTPTLAVLQYQ